MSFPCMGLTHCLNCGTSLDMGELFYCEKCNKEQKEKERKEQEEQKLKEQREIVKEEILKELNKDTKENKVSNKNKKNKSNSNSENYLDVITISSIKPNNLTYDQWYADIGYRVIERYQKGFDGVLLAIDNKTKM